jgi:hypothetical protein
LTEGVKALSLGYGGWRMILLVNGQNAGVGQRSWSGCRPVKFSLVGLDPNVVDAGFSTAHQAVGIKLPQLIPVGSKPPPGHVVVFVLVTHGDAIV